METYETIEKMETYETPIDKIQPQSHIDIDFQKPIYFLQHENKSINLRQRNKLSSVQIFKGFVTHCSKQKCVINICKINVTRSIDEDDEGNLIYDVEYQSIFFKLHDAMNEIKKLMI